VSHAPSIDGIGISLKRGGIIGSLRRALPYQDDRFAFGQTLPLSKMSDIFLKVPAILFFRDLVLR
jgi:hypothetical protein